MERKREIYIKIEQIENIKTLMEEIRELEEDTKKLFRHYESVSHRENEMLENWNNYIEDILQKLDHVAV